jgi:hypothetical protein
MKPFAPRLQIGKTGPQLPFTPTSRCCGAACYCGHSCITQHFVGSNANLRSFKQLGLPFLLMQQLFAHAARAPLKCNQHRQVIANDCETIEFKLNFCRQKSVSQCLTSEMLLGISFGPMRTWTGLGSNACRFLTGQR